MSFGNEREFIDLQQLEERKEQAMKCPLFVAAVVIKAGTSKGAEVDCLKETCAWWLPQGNVCAIASLACDMQNIYPTLQDIQNKMPHAVQFKK